MIRFACIPERAYRAPIGLRAHRTLIVIATVGKAGGPSQPTTIENVTHTKIAEQLGIHRRGVQREIDALIDAGLLHVKRRRSGNRYTIPFDDVSSQETTPAAPASAVSSDDIVSSQETAAAAARVVSGGDALTESGLGALASLPRWVVEWRIEEPLFIEQAAVAAALTAAENAAVPADPRLVAVELDRMLELYGMPANWDAIADEYLEVFEDVPPDLVRLAFKRMRRSPRDYLPKPGQLLSLIVGDLAARKLMLFKLQLALTRRRDPETERPPPTEAEIRQVDEMVTAAVRSIATKSAAAFYDQGALPRGGRDPARRPQESDRQSAAANRKRVADETAGFRLVNENDPGVLARLREMGVEPPPASVDLLDPPERDGDVA